MLQISQQKQLSSSTDHYHVITGNGVTSGNNAPRATSLAWILRQCSRTTVAHFDCYFELKLYHVKQLFSIRFLYKPNFHYSISNMISMLIIFSFALLSVSESARYARFNEDYVSAFGDFASNGNVVYLGAKNKVLKLHFARRAFIAQFEVLSSMCPLGNEACSDYTQHSLIADGRTFGVSV